MSTPFCKKCGTLITTKRLGADRKLIYWCPICRNEVVEVNKKAFQEQCNIKHTERDITRIIENEAPPIPKVMTSTFAERKKKRCRHPNAVFQGFYQFSSGDEASRKYWHCPDCGQVFRFSGKTKVKAKRKIIYSKKEDLLD
jgi:DNA-directed RNA polymerase subunit M/transcription elongation factor TFIIS